VVLNGQRRRPHGHAGQARPAPPHNPDEVDERRGRPAASLKTYVRTYPWQLSSGPQDRTEELRYRAGTELGSSPSQLRTLLPDKWQCMGSFGDTSRQSYIQKSSQPHRAPAGWLVGHPLLPVARNRHRRRWLARNLDLPSSARRGCSACVCLLQ
jgi:hypothetical protein